MQIQSLLQQTSAAGSNSSRVTTPNPHHALGWAVCYLSWSEANCMALPKPCMHPSAQLLTLVGCCSPVPAGSHGEGGWRSCHLYHNAASPKGSTQSRIRGTWGTGTASTALPTLRKRRSRLPLTSVCLLSAHDSHHCHIQGTLQQGCVNVN